MSEIKSTLVDIKALHLEYAFDKGVNFAARVITISEEITENTFRKVDAALTEMENDGTRNITVRINSTGGSVYDALAIVGRMMSSKCDINTVGYGSVMSAAVLILAAGKKRKMSSIGWFMVHEAHYRVNGTVSQHKEYLGQALREEEQWAAEMAKRSKKDKSFWLKIIRKMDTYFVADELLQHGVIDEII